MDNSTNAVPYQPYRSKRHSRTLSSLAAESRTPTPVPPAPVVNSHATSSNGYVPHATDERQCPPDMQLQPDPVQNLTNGHVVAAWTSTSTPSSVTSTPSSSKQTLSASTSSTASDAPSVSAPSSTFRHVPPRTATATSPLRPNALPRPPTHSLSVSPSFARKSAVRHIGPREPSPLQDQHSPNPPAPELARRVSAQGPHTAAHVLSPTAVPSIGITPPPTQIIASATSSASGPTVPPLAVSSLPPAPVVPPAPSLAPSSSSLPRRAAAPYRPGFQPKGVYRPRTDEFMSARSSVRDRDKIEQRRLERRLEKLIALHFPQNQTSSPEKEKTTELRRSSLFDLDFRKAPTELWRGVVESRIQGSKADIRAEEKCITPWEDDAAVSQCPLCATSFHPLTNRKHHCRLCGRIVCSLPPHPPTRVHTCSLLFVADQRSGCIEEVGEGVDYGVKRRGSTNGKAEEEDKFLKGVRICRDCKTVLLRKQYLQEASRVPTFARLYASLVALEKDIEDALPQFQELVLSLSTNTASHNAPSAAMRKRLLDSFGEYDRLSKRIRQLPTPRGGSQDRVQSAILTRANLFLQKNMFPLQTIPKPQKQSSIDSSSQSDAQVVDTDSQLAHRLQPLLEQEALLESFVEEARAQRKFEDARTLKTNLGEIRAEIERIAQGSDRNG